MFDTDELTVIVKSDFIGQRFVRRCKHRTLVFEEAPFGAVGVSFFFPPNRHKQRLSEQHVE